jgi:hypothetical protein
LGEAIAVEGLKLEIDFDLKGIAVDFAYSDGTNDNSRIR